MLPIDSSATGFVQSTTGPIQAGDIPVTCHSIGICRSGLGRGEAVRRFGTHLSDERLPLVPGDGSWKMFPKIETMRSATWKKGKSGEVKRSRDMSGGEAKAPRHLRAGEPED